MWHLDEVITHLQHKEEQQATQPKQLDIFDAIKEKDDFPLCNNNKGLHL